MSRYIHQYLTSIRAVTNVRVLERKRRHFRLGLGCWRVPRSGKLGQLGVVKRNGTPTLRGGRLRNRLLASANVGATPLGYLQLLGMERRARRSPGAASEEEVTMIYIRCYQSCSQPAIIPIIIIA